MFVCGPGFLWLAISCFGITFLAETTGIAHAKVKSEKLANQHQ